MIILALQIIRYVTDYRITDRALLTLRSIVQVSMLINVFLLANEVFKEFYSGNLHVASSKYLYVGLHGRHALVPWIWTAIGFNLLAMVLLVLPVSRSLRWLNLTCVLCIIGIWIEKGMDLVIPGFIPTPLGEMLDTGLRSTRRWCASASGRSASCATPSSSGWPCLSCRGGFARPTKAPPPGPPPLPAACRG